MHHSVPQSSHQFIVVLGPWISPRECLACPRIWSTWSSLLKLFSWTFSILVRLYAFTARCDVLIRVWQYVSCHNMAKHFHLLHCGNFSELSKHFQRIVFCAPVLPSWTLNVNTVSNNTNDLWQFQRVEFLKFQETIGRKQTLRTVYHHKHFHQPYAPSHCSPKTGAHFMPHHARLLFLHWTAEPISNLLLYIHHKHQISGDEFYFVTYS